MHGFQKEEGDRSVKFISKYKQEGANNKKIPFSSYFDINYFLRYISFTLAPPIALEVS
jgi:hypothetical protein